MLSGDITYSWRGAFTNAEIHALHADAFGTRLFDESEWNWVAQCNSFSLGWVVARDDSRFVGFVNVLWDGLVHAFIEDVMVDATCRHRKIGVGLVHAARDGAREAGCEFLHVGFDADLAAFYVDACGFSPTNGGLMTLT
jgi:GNAT superfamily N-acetyltransferase